MSDPEPRDIGTSSRPPPRVVRVPPPEVKRGLVLPCLVTIALLATICVLFGVQVSSSNVVFIVLVVLAAAGVIACWWRNLRMQRIVIGIKRRVCVQAPDWDQNPIAAKIARRWRWATLAPDAAEIEEITRVYRYVAYIVCLGGVDVPSVGDRRFEPVIITPGRRWQEILMDAIFIGLVLIALFCCLGIPILQANRSMQLAWLIPLIPALLAGVYAYSRFMLGTTYVRLAPGMVQFLRYGIIKNNPRVTSFPMTGGTLIVMDNEISLSGRQRLILTFRRDNRDLTLPVWRFSNQQEIMNHVWQALLSTAPTPPLSDEELVG